jgi:nucleoside-diphosphate-sugar epimerase
MQNIWILGGTGFIGKALVNKLSGNSQYLLHLLVHKNVPYRFLEPFNIFTGNLEDFNFKWMEKYTPHIIIHLARFGGRNSLTRYLASKNGAKANWRFINFLCSMKEPPMVVYVSGSLMYGNQVADEYSMLSPISYARHYIRAEEPWLGVQATKLLDVRMARPGWILGPNSWFKIFYWNYFVQTGKIPLYGNGNQLMSLIDLEDCAGQIINLAENGSKGQNLNIYSGYPVSQKLFAETLANHLNTSIDPISEKKLVQCYGKTVAEALNSSIHLQTKFTELLNKYTLCYPGLEEMLTHTISMLEYEKAILAKTP